ncbi:hypothetical protein NFI96_002358 [Prochilodus magdalenae]|nr:hypothetical protein NFI96_002358 [Prochilodus magdalenae]
MRGDKMSMTSTFKPFLFWEVSHCCSSTAPVECCISAGCIGAAAALPAHSCYSKPREGDRSGSSAEVWEENSKEVHILQHRSDAPARVFPVQLEGKPTKFPKFPQENCRTAVGKGYVAGLLTLYEEWHTHDSEHQHLPIRQALLHCLHKATNTSLGRSALVTDGGIGLLYRSTQTCLLSKATECLVEPAVQLMRKCYPKVPLPLPSDRSAYSFPVPGQPVDAWVDDPGANGPPQDHHSTAVTLTWCWCEWIRHSSASGHLSGLTGLGIVHQPKLSSTTASCRQRPVGSVLWGSVLWAASYGQRPVGQCPVGSVLWVASCGQRPVGQCPVGQRPVGSVLWAASCGAVSCGQRLMGSVLWGSVLWAASYGQRPVGQSPVGSVLWASVTASCGAASCGAASCGAASCVH